MSNSSIISSKGRTSARLRLKPGSVIADGKYKIIALVGEGATGQVFRAVHTALGRTVAIKVFLSDGETDDLGEARFLREAQAASKLHHPALMQVLDFGSEKGICYIVMEFLDGPNLAQVIAEDAPMAPDRISRLMLQVLAALALAHEHGVIHRDLKPENIILLRHHDDDGVPVESLKVCDFGIAKIQPAAGQEPHNTLTQEGTVVGTPCYMSPEQCSASEIDQRSDIYSCGVILYQMATGTLPFWEQNPMMLMVKHLSEQPPHPAEVHEQIHPLLASIILKCLKKNPEERYADARAMREDLKKIAPSESNRPVASPRVSTPGHPRNFVSPDGMQSPVVIPPPTDSGSVANLADTAPVDSNASIGATRASRFGQSRRSRLWMAIIGTVLVLQTIVFWMYRAFEEDESVQPDARPSDVSVKADDDVSVPGELDSNSGEDVPLRRQDSDAGTSVDNAGDNLPVKNVPVENAVSGSPQKRAIGGRGGRGRRGVRTEISRNNVAGARTPEAEQDDSAAAELTAAGSINSNESSLDSESENGGELQLPRANSVAVKDAVDTVAQPTENGATSVNVQPASNAPARTSPIAAHETENSKTQPVKEKATRTPLKPALDATVSLRDLSVKGSLPLAPIRSGINRFQNRWIECYQQAARSAGRDARVSLQVYLVIDEDGRASRPSVSRSSLSNLSQCVSREIPKIRSRTRPDTGTVQVTFKLLFSPKPPLK